MQPSFDSYLRQLKETGYASDSVTAYQSVFNHLGGTPITKDSLRLFSLKILGYKAATRSAYLMRVRQYLRVAEPRLVKEIVLPKVDRSLPNAIPAQHEVAKLLQKPDVMTFKGLRDRAILEVFYSTGVRKRELMALKLEVLWD
jgi:site-specific recombinase XerD